MLFIFSTKLLDHHISYLRLLQPHQQANTCKFLKIRRKRQNIIFDKPLRKRDHLCADHFSFFSRLVQVASPHGIINEGRPSNEPNKSVQAGIRIEQLNDG